MTTRPMILAAVAWRAGCWTVWVVTLSASVAVSFAQAPPASDALTPDQWLRVDSSVDRALAWIASQQAPDGSFPTAVGGQPAVTSLAVMAMLSKGHLPGQGPYGETINRAVDYALSCQRPSGALVLDRTDMPVHQWYRGSHTGLYNHAITGLMLGEVYGLTDAEREPRLRLAIQQAIRLARETQQRPGPHPEDKHAWRYFHPLKIPQKGEADLSVTGWFVMFYRSARNAEFEVPEQYVLEAASFVRACYREEEGAFRYGPYGADRFVGRGMTGAGLLCLTLTGQSDDRIARSAGDWLLRHPFDRYGGQVGSHDRFHYGAYYCSQAMFLLGGEHWRQFYPQLVQTLLAAQTPAGSWPRESPNDGAFGSVYSTSMAVLSLTPPHQLLPIYQR